MGSWRITASQLQEQLPLRGSAKAEGFSSLFIPSSRRLPKETTRLVVPLPGSGVSRALPTTSLHLQKPSRQKGHGADAAPATEPATEATRAHPNIWGRRQRMQRKEHVYASLPTLNLPTQHPSGDEVHKLVDKPCGEQELTAPRERREASQEHRVTAALKATPAHSGPQCQGQPWKRCCL